MEQKNQTGHKNIIVMGKLLMNEGITQNGLSVVEVTY